jgi:predicted nuclease of predicted toxin-antitoxin system
MRLYLDDDSASLLLVQLLRRAGHDVQRSVDAGLAGADDPVHLGHAVRVDRVLLSHNHRDFQNLHNLVLIVQGDHPDILVVRKDNNPKRDLNEQVIVRALAKLLAASVALADQFYVLNHWR